MSRYYAGANDERRATLAAIDSQIAGAELTRTDAERCENRSLALAAITVANVLRSLRKQIIKREIVMPTECRSELDRQAWVAAMEAVTRAQGKSC